MDRTNLVRALLIAVILAFGAYTAAAVIEHGFSDFIEKIVDNTATLQVVIDLSIVATLALIWMYRDSRSANSPPFLPNAIVTVFAGSFGPLTYLLHRTWRLPAADR